VKTIRKSIALIVCLFIIVSVNAQQEAGWFLGTWKGGAATKKSNNQKIQISFEIIKVEGDSYEGLVKVLLLSDTSVHLDSKVTGTITKSYMTAKIGEIIYKKDPPGGRWETRCSTCGPIHFSFAVKDEKFVMRGETKDCLQQCNGVSVYMRNLDDFDPDVRASMVAMVNGEQKNEETKPKEPVIAKVVKEKAKEEGTIPFKALPKGSLVAATKKQLPDNEPALHVNPVHEKGVAVKEELFIYYEPIDKRKLAVVPLKQKEILFDKPVFTVNRIHAKGAGIKAEPFVFNMPVDKSLLTVAVLPKKQLPVIRKTITVSKFKSPLAVKVPPQSAILALAEKLNKPVASPANTLVQKQEKIVTKTVIPVKQAAQKDTIKEVATTKPLPFTAKSADTPAIKKLEIAVTKPAPVRKDSAVVTKKEVFEKRATNIVKSFEVTTDSITIRLFDNGVVDGDTISVFNNDEVVISRISLTSRAYEMKIAVNKNQDNKIVMYAHNLGEIPPNTALMEIYSSKQMYSLLITSDLQKSSGIVLKYKQDE
jgi:hypothetical protein